MGQTFRYRALGVAFIGLIVLGVFLVYAVFAQKFTHYDTVYADASEVGLNLPDRADVKVRGEIIGEAVGNLRDHVCGCGRDDDEVGFAAQANVTHLGFIFQREKIGVGFGFGEGGDGERRDELCAARGENAAHAATSLADEADQLE